MISSKNITIAVFIALALLLSACAAPTATQPVANAPAGSEPTSVPATQAPPSLVPPTQAPTQPPATQAPTAGPTAASGITVDVLKNFTFTGPTYGKTYPLVMGKYEATSGADTVRVTLLDPIAFGDLNGDGKPDAAVLLGENGGGTGTFVSLITLLDENGQPVQNSAISVDDRPKINSLTIQDGKIILDAQVHGVSDPMCCASMPVLRTYMPGTGGLMLIRQESTTPNGAKRAIDITSPTDGATVSRPVQLQGSVTIAPFENNLVYRVLDAQGNKLAEGPLMVNAANPGDPGTFDTAIDLSGVPAGQPVWLGVYDVSAADGSTLAMDSVQITRK